MRLNTCEEVIVWGRTRRRAHVFAYGSLIWKPGFAPLARDIGLLYRWHRAPCLRSEHFRGNRDLPGVVFGLDHGGSCRGVLLELPARDRDSILATIWAREMVTDAYQPRQVRVNAAAGTVEALTFTVCRHHPQYLPPSERAAMIPQIARAHGISGSNHDYVRETAQALQAHGLVDRHLARLLARLDTRQQVT